MENAERDKALAQEGNILKKVTRELAALEEMNLAQLRERYQALFGEEARTKNLPFLRKKLAFRLQERTEGGLSPHAQTLIIALGPQELPQGAARKGRRPATAPPAVAKAQPGQPRDPRLPEPGIRLVRNFGGLAHEVEVQVAGFAYRGRSYRSLSAIAKEISGTSWNGFAFFGLKKEAVDGQA